MKIIYEEGTKYLFPQQDEGFQRIREILSRALDGIGSDLASATTSDYRKLFRRGWTEVIEELAPYETYDRVSQRFRKLVF